MPDSAALVYKTGRLSVGSCSVSPEGPRPAGLRALAGDGPGRDAPHWTGGEPFPTRRTAGTHQTAKLGCASSDRDVGRGAATALVTVPRSSPDALADAYALL